MQLVTSCFNRPYPHDSHSFNKENNSLIEHVPVKKGLKPGQTLSLFVL